MRVLLINVVFLGIFLLLGAVAAEIFLRFDGRYADLTRENLTNSMAVWDRPANDIQYRKHPDLEHEVKIVFNDFQIRNHHDVTLQDINAHAGGMIGVFGDSYTENRRIDDEFTFTSLLGEILRPEFMVLNFGVDGYGLDQSYLKYLAFKQRERLQYVFYVFYYNDLRNLYEVQLFDFRGDGIGELRIREISPFINFARRFHVTYLLLDSYGRLKARLRNELDDAGDINEKLIRKFGSRKINAFQQERKARLHDTYADSMAMDFLSDSPTEDTQEWVSRFRLLLQAWQREVESHGGKFIILVIPDRVSTRMAKQLFGEQFPDSVVYLDESFSEGYEEFIFRNDGHWNEAGNLRAAQALAAWGEDHSYWSYDHALLGRLTERTEAAIRTLYSE